MAKKKKKKLAERIEYRKLNEAFNITTVCRIDLMNEEVGFTKARALKITDAQMRRIATKMADDYCNQLFWGSLKIIAEYVEEEE